LLVLKWPTETHNKPWRLQM